MNAPAGNEAKPSGYDRLVQFMHYVPGGALLFAVMPLLFLGYFAWYHWGAEHLDKALYAVRLENLVTTPQPTWIRNSRVREEVFENGGLGQLSLLDPQASATIAHAFESHSWVARATRVTKMAGGKVVVDISYRRPVAMIRYEGSDSTGQQPAQKGFYPVDEAGVILPTSDFDPSQVLNYFIVHAEGAVPPTDVGMAFADTRIKQALELCRFLEPKRLELQLSQIHVVRDDRWASANPWLMYLTTTDNRRIHWGHAPGTESPNEPLAQDKLTRLIRWRADGAATIELDLSSPAPYENRLTSGAPQSK